MIGMENNTVEQNGQCQCGDTTFTIKNKPIIRLLCHCNICQEFNHAPYGDVAIFLSKDVEMKKHNKVHYKKYKMPPAIQRGKCTTCDKPAVEMIKLPMLPGFTIIPSANIPTGDFLPDPSMHIFYHRRVNDINDNLPKISGFLKSQVLLGGRIMSAMLKSKGLA